MHCALTIVSKNYFSFAATLAASYLKQHPQHAFYIVLVDRRDDLIPRRLECGAEIIEVEEIPIPDLSRFLYRYSIMEANTAVKPYAMRFLLERGQMATVTYIDPDILVFRRLVELEALLQRSSIVLIPHTRTPFHDDLHPSDLSILQSGTYNLGFVSVRRGEAAIRMLDWWAEKLYRDCIVDIPRGLFVDQKWIDLVPGFFPECAILHDPGYNVAYWNLHEREISRESGGWRVAGVPLSFFHFSGYSPFRPDSLSKHQSRFDLEKMPGLRELTDEYASLLFGNGYIETSDWPYAFETLSNGVKLPMPIVRDIMQWASRAGIQTPDPFTEGDEFCRFLMSRGRKPDRPQNVLLYDALLDRRPDVVAAFHGCRENTQNRDFRLWISRSGNKEEKLSKELIAYEDSSAIDDYVADAFRRLRLAERNDVFSFYEKLWEDSPTFEGFAEWFERHGVGEMNFTPEHKRRLLLARQGILTCLHIYFLRGDLQQAFPHLRQHDHLLGFESWLRRNLLELSLTQEDVSLFREFCEANPEYLERLRALYGRQSPGTEQAVSAYNSGELVRVKGLAMRQDELARWLLEIDLMSPLDHFVAHYSRKPLGNETFAEMSVAGLSPKANFRFVEACRQPATSQQKAVNVAGVFTAPTGMGESARSMSATLRAAGLRVYESSLPSPRSRGAVSIRDTKLFGWPSSTADLSISVQNADSVIFSKHILPRSFRAPVNVGYWVWETEALPVKWAEGAREFDEIWTPSTYSAEAIRKVVRVPVRVLPHTLQFGEIEKAVAHRTEFRLPKDRVLYGFIFDPQSSLERKNVAGVISAYKRAFKKDDKTCLVLKANGVARGAYDYEKIKALARGEGVIFIEDHFDRAATFRFMKSLDVYVSLHRSEGFGLTCAEAMAAGLPVVASSYSANLDFMSPDCSLLIPGKVIETERPHGAYPRGTRWFDPDLDAAAEAMRKLLHHSERIVFGRKGSQVVRGALAANVVAEAANRLVAAVLLKAQPSE